MKSRPTKRVRVTIELPESFIRLLNAKAVLKGWTKWSQDDDDPPEMDAGDIVAWLVLMEGRGALEDQIHQATPMMWRAGGPEIIHAERRVIETENV
jgi:hypothetical protein